MKKLLTALLSLSLLLSLSACGKDRTAGKEDPTASYAQEFAQAVAGMDADAVMFTVNGEKVTAEYYLYWLAYDCYDWNSYTGGTVLFDSEVTEGKTAAQFLKEDAQRMAAFYVTLEQKAAALDCGLTEAQWAEWEEIKAAYREGLGEDGFALSLRQMGLSESSFDRIGALREMSGMYDNLTAVLTTQPTKEDMDKYTEENDAYKAKHILLLTAVEGEDGTVSLSTGGTPTNADGAPFTGTAEEYNRAVMEQMQDILSQVDQAADPAAKFDELMRLYSEDTGLAANPDGYLFSSGQMVSEFENATKGLEYGEYTKEPVESRFGYHILLRLDVEQECRDVQMGEIISQWIDEMTIENVSAEYEAVDVADFFEQYTAYAEKLYTEWQERQTAAS